MSQAPQRRKLLLHVCCAPCATAPIERLRSRGRYEITAFFYNPNIYPRREYELRLDQARRLCLSVGMELAIGPYEPDRFDAAVAGLEDEPEGGRRCRRCFELRLTETARYARLHGFEVFAATLTVSPHKSAKLINELGAAAAGKEGLEFLAEDFKKRDGFRRSVELSREHDLYRQNYCGCRHSMRRSIGPGGAD